MRALLINPRTPPSFWSFPEQCLFSGRSALCPPLGLITVAAMIPIDWELRLVDQDAQAITESDWEWAEIVMLSGMIVQRDSLLNLIVEAGRRGKPCVVGGPYVTSVPDEALAAGCNYLVRGEAENTLGLFLAALADGKASGVFEVDHRPDITKSPVPRFDMLELDKYLVVSLQTSRGCPFDCEFCDIVNLYGRKPRCKTPDQVIAELETIYNLGWRRDVFISDDNFIGSRSHTMALLSKLTPWMKSHGEPFGFTAQTSVNLGQDLELIDLMTEANFANVFIGVESPDEEVLASAHKFHNIRNPLVESLNTIKKNGLSILASFVIGFDGEKKGIGQRIVSFVEQTDIPILMLNLLQVLPNTKLWDRLKSEGRLLEEATTGQSTGGRLNFVPNRPESEILDEYFRCWDTLYEHSRFLDRNYRYYTAMRPTRNAMGENKENESEPNRTQQGRPFSEKMADLLRFTRLSLRQGLKYGCRRQYWRQLFGILKKNPSRFVPYIVRSIMGEDMFRLRESLCKDASYTNKEKT